MTINASSGAISWTPTEAQGPSTNVITVVVTDTNAAALVNRQLSTTNTFTVAVNEVNPRCHHESKSYLRFSAFRAGNSHGRGHSGEYIDIFSPHRANRNDR